MSARDEILGRVRAAIASAEVPVVPRAYREAGDTGSAECVRRFVERVEDYGGVVVSTDDPPIAIAEALRVQGARRVGIPGRLEPILRPEGVELVVDDQLAPEVLDALDGSITTSAVACAETGTIALTGGPGEGRRALTLVPDLHVCLVRRDDVVATVPELFSRLQSSARVGRPIVLVSGPSATSDIELTRVEGVHGPRRLVVVLTG